MGSGCADLPDGSMYPRIVYTKALSGSLCRYFKAKVYIHVCIYIYIYIYVCMYTMWARGTFGSGMVLRTGKCRGREGSRLDDVEKSSIDGFRV